MSGESGYCSEPGEYGSYQGEEEISEESDYIKPKVSKRDLGVIIPRYQLPRSFDEGNVKPEALHQVPGMNYPKAASKGKQKNHKECIPDWGVLHKTCLVKD